MNDSRLSPRYGRSGPCCRVSKNQPVRVNQVNSILPFAIMLLRMASPNVEPDHHLHSIRSYDFIDTLVNQSSHFPSMGFLCGFGISTNLFQFSRFVRDVQRIAPYHKFTFKVNLL